MMEKLSSKMLISLPIKSQESIINIAYMRENAHILRTLFIGKV